MRLARAECEGRRDEDDVCAGGAEGGVDVREADVVARRQADGAYGRVVENGAGEGARARRGRLAVDGG